MFRSKLFLLGLLVVGVGIVSGCAGQDPEPGPTPTPDGTENCVVDDSVRGQTADAWKLSPDEESELNFICPKGDIDHYWFELDSPRTIVEIELKNNVNLTEVDYCYDLFYESHEKQVGSACDFDGSDGMTRLRASFYLENDGTYFVEVRDASHDDYDTRNPYLISIATQQDPDTNEPNNLSSNATVLTPDQDTTGYISYLKDQDWYVINVSEAGQVIEIDLSTGESSPVDLQYTLYKSDGQTPVNEGADLNGQDGATALMDMLPVKQNGTYYLRVQDRQDNDSDLQVGYVLRVGLHHDPDVKDQTAPYNNSFENAETLTSGVAVTGRAISYRGDEDWFVIDTSSGVPALLEVDLNYQGSRLDPQVELLYADPDHACNPQDSCNLLNRPCAAGCDSVECSNARCPSHECVLHENKCRGAGMCLPRGASGNGCGIGMLVMRGLDWSEDGNPRHLRTMAPMLAQRYFIRVTDFQSDDFDLGATYSLKVTVRSEPDSHEPNGLYNPYLTSEQEEYIRDWNYTKARQVDCTTTPSTFATPDEITKIECSLSGYLSFRGDQDWFKLVVPYEDNPDTPDVVEEDFFIPKLNESDPATMGENIDWDVVFSWDYAGRESLEAGVVLFSGYQRMGFTAGVGEQSGTWGAGLGQCSYFCGEYHAPTEEGYVWVFTPDFRGYDFDTPYSVTVTATRGCPTNCSYCSASCNAWCCPNPNNPTP